MSLTDAAELNMAKLVMRNEDWANVARGLVSAGSFFVGLYTADPGETGTQETSEVAYTGYARIAVARTSGGWTAATVSDVTTSDNVAKVTFAQRSGGGTPTATHVGFGTASTGAGNLVSRGVLNNPLVIDGTVTPEFAIGALDIVFT